MCLLVFVYAFYDVEKIRRSSDLRTLLRDGVSDAELKAQIEMTITQKPKCHHFGEINEPEQTEHRGMSEIGG